MCSPVQTYNGKVSFFFVHPLSQKSVPSKNIAYMIYLEICPHLCFTYWIGFSNQKQDHGFCLSLQTGESTIISEFSHIFKP